MATFKTSVSFPGEQAHDFVVEASRGPHLPVFYQDVLIDPDDPRSGIQAYAVALAASNRWCESCQPEWVVQKKPQESAPQLEVLGPSTRNSALSAWAGFTRSGTGSARLAPGRR